MRVKRCDHHFPAVRREVAEDRVGLAVGEVERGPAGQLDVAPGDHHLEPAVRAHLVGERRREVFLELRLNFLADIVGRNDLRGKIGDDPHVPFAESPLRQFAARHKRRSGLRTLVGASGKH